MSNKQIKARLIMENGREFEGTAFGSIHDTIGEVVFTTGMTGYQETLTDPSFAGQIVVMTYPLIGNYGINLEDMESDGPKLKGFVVREQCETPCNWRCEMELSGFLKQHNIMGLEGIDTRALTRLIRTQGAMKGMIVTGEPDRQEVQKALEAYSMKDVVKEVCCREKYTIEGGGPHLAFIDFGSKRSIVDSFVKRGCRVTVMPPGLTAEEILSENPDGVFLSNGPGDPKDLPQVIETVRGLLGKTPVVGICLGHQLLSLALGCDTSKLPFGHHGANHPVKELDSGRCYITSQNHEYVVSSLGSGVEASFRNVNDGTVEGIRHKDLRAESVQFHPEASPGPLDTGFMFDRFINLINGEKAAEKSGKEKHYA